MNTHPDTSASHLPTPQQSDPLFSTILDLLLDAVCVVDAQGYFVFASAACEAIFGYTPQEMIGRRMIDMVEMFVKLKDQLGIAYQIELVKANGDEVIFIFRKIPSTIA